MYVAITWYDVTHTCIKAVQSGTVLLPFFYSCALVRAP